ncbi:hypothetical protein A3860_18490 [Niastella vici]|uniref:Uncharacterized protein n=1 Tax=Niastella vici TaxID=1703345 RepID=A0A1V9G2L5_9BACT|nr:hypothetical protein [Niastella vici]OQP64748.1 hypothetical protein A3860_18490 [Niastella vici]
MDDAALKIEASFKLQKAIEVLKEKLIKKDVYQMIVDYHLGNEKFRFSESTFSKCINACENSIHIHTISRKHFSYIFEVIDPYIKSTYELIWNDSKKEYVKEETLSLSANETVNKNARLLELTGGWIGYSWNENRTKEKNIPHINIFKLNIRDIDKITCVTEKAEFKEGKMNTANHDRLIIDLVNSHRKIILIGHIGLAEEGKLKKLDRIHLAYVDTGDRNVKTGLAIIERTDIEFSNIETESKEITFFDIEKADFLMLHLQNTQLIIKS